MKTHLIAASVIVLASGSAARAFDCKAILNIPAESVSETTVKSSVDVNGLAKRLLNASGDAEVLSKTRELLQKFPLGQQSLICSQLTYLACGVLNEEKTTPLQARLAAVERMTKSCYQIQSEAIAQGTSFGASKQDDHFTGGPAECHRSESKVVCVLAMESSNRDRFVLFDSESAELVDDEDSPYEAATIRIGQYSGQNVRYEFKSDTRTKVELRFDGVEKTSKAVQTLTISPQNYTDYGRVRLRYRNIQID